MKNIYTIVLILFVSTAFAQLSGFQEIKISKKDSIRMVNLPEMKMTYEYTQNRSPLPLAVDNSTEPYWRGIFQQAGCSCGQASSEAYVFTYEINRKRNLDATLDNNRYAYSFTYNFLNIGNSVCGASWLESQDIIREAGIPNLPTNGGVLTDSGMKEWLSGYDKYYSAMQNRINNVYAIHLGTPEGLNVLKHWLYDHLEGSPYGGMAFFYANHVDYPEELVAGTPNAGKHIVTGFSNTSHSMSIVGYDDEIRYDYNNDGQYTNDIDITGDGIVDMKDWEIGALKMANTYSGGVSGGIFNWADSGFCYIMYRVLPYHNSSGGIWDKAVYVSDVKENYTPLLTAKVNMTYDSRDKIKIMAGVSTDLSATFPDHVEEFPHFRFQGDALYMQGGSDEADKTIEFGLDLSELLNHVDSNQAAKYFLYIKEDDSGNAGTGVVNSFSVIDYTNGVNEYISSQTNVPVVDNGNTLISTEATINYQGVKIITDTLPKAELNNSYSASVEAQGGTGPYKWFPFYNYKITSISNTFIPITGNNLPIEYSNVSLDFNFPFYGKKYNIGTVSKYGKLTFEHMNQNVPYDRDYSVIMRYFKGIAPFHGESYTANIRYEGDATYAKFYWIAEFDGVNMEYMITLFPDGTIYIDYGSGSTPGNPEWSAGISKGDQVSYQEFDFSGGIFPANTRLILEPRPFPTGLDIDDNGLLSGVLTEEFTGDSLFVKVIDNNWLEEVKGFLFTNSGLLFSNYQVNTSDNNTLEYGEIAQLSLDLSNVGEVSINNIELELIDNDPNYLLIDSLESHSTLNIGETATLTGAFEFQINEQIQDNTLLSFIVQVEADEVSANDTITFLARAPKIDIVDLQVQDGNDNILDPGETADLLVYYKNIGGSEASSLVISCSSTDAYININSVSNNTKSLLNPDSIWVVTLNITANISTPEGYVSVIDSEMDGDKSFHSVNDVNVGIGLIVENWESGTTGQYPWGLGGTQNWFLDTNTVHEGTYALKSGVISHNQISSLSLTGAVGTGGEISFYKKVSSEVNYDYLRFYIDSVLVAEWEGEEDWAEHVYPITAGLHTFEWKYEKDVTVSSGSDAAWVDFIVLPAIDFSDPEVQVSPSIVDKVMSPNELDTDTIYVSNIGGGILNYIATIDDATITQTATIASGISNITTPNNKSIEGSTFTSNTSSIFTGIPFSIDVTLTNNSPDNEYIEYLTLSLPLGVSLDSATHFVGGSGGDMEWDQIQGNGNDVTWFGEQADGWGVLHVGQSATATLFLTIDPAITNSIILQYIIGGEIYGADPHTITDFLVLTNNGTNDTWLTLGDTSGALIANQNKVLLLNYNTFGIPEGTYTCTVSVFSDTDSLDVPVTLQVIDALGINEFRNSLSIYPNPAKTYFTIENPTESESHLEVFDATGKLIHNTVLNHKFETIQIEDWAQGLYLVILHQKDKRYTQKVIVE